MGLTTATQPHEGNKGSKAGYSPPCCRHQELQFQTEIFHPGSNPHLSENTKQNKRSFKFKKKKGNKSKHYVRTWQTQRTKSLTTGVVPSSGHQTLPWLGELGLHTGRLLSVRPGEGAGILLEGKDPLLLSLSPPEHALSSPAPPGPHSVCTATPSVPLKYTP